MRVEFASGGKGSQGGPMLEGVWTAGPEGAGRGAAVICHPHPLFGGSMHNNVVYGLADGLGRAGFGVLCFNFRGVGRSRGSYDEGVGEVDDVLGALAFAAEQPGVSTDRLFLAGYSFGGLIALYAAGGGAGIAGLALVSPMPPPRGFSKDERLEDFRKGGPPFIAVYGDRDMFCPESAVKDLNRSSGGRGKLVLVQGADHFWAGLEDDSTGPVVEFFTQTLP